jgi:hypothetical protein
MYLRVFDSRVSSRHPPPSPSLCYSLTHAHRSIGHRNRNPQPLSGSPARLMYLRVYDSRVSSRQPPYVYMTVELALTSLHPPRPYATRSHMHTAPSPLPRTITCTQVLWFLERLTRPTVSFSETTRTRLSRLSYTLSRLSSAYIFSLSSHRHSYIGFVLSSRFIDS